MLIVLEILLGVVLWCGIVLILVLHISRDPPLSTSEARLIKRFRRMKRRSPPLFLAEPHGGAISLPPRSRHPSPLSPSNIPSRRSCQRYRADPS